MKNHKNNDSFDTSFFSLLQNILGFFYYFLYFWDLWGHNSKKPQTYKTDKITHNVAFLT